MMEKNELPKGWKILPLSEICDQIDRANQKSQLGNGQFLYIDINSIDNSIYEIVEPKVYDWKNAPSRAQQKVKNGDVLFSTVRPYLKNIARVTDKYNNAIASTGFCVLRPTKVDSKYVFYYVLTSDFIKSLNKIARGTSYPAVRNKDIYEQNIPLPPLPEQHRIVAKIEALFSQLDNGIAQLKTAQAQLKVYRQAVLKWAFEGRLTNKDVQEGELPEGWKWIKSGDLFTFVTSGSRGWAKYYSNDGSIFIRITNLDFDSLELDLDQKNIQYVNPPSNSEGLRTKVQEGDFLFSITGYLGMFAIAPKLENAYVNQHIALCRPKDGFDKKFVGYWIISKSGGIYHLNKMEKGATKSGLGLDDIKSFPVPLATLPEQHRVVQEIESRLSVCDKLEETITQALQQSEALRQSILKRAFEGRLVK